ncbi:MAG TPA: hypothetical protein VFK57_15470 [Vicinamibacterales bacterium]|nr:hypothetical protein [Vicinamibacterales bacterium]
MRTVPTAIALALLAAAAGVTGRGADLFAQLGIPMTSAEQAAITIISNGLHNPGLPSTSFKLLPPAVRAELATAGVAWLKAYTKSPAFKTQYGNLRETHKPQPPQFEGTPEDELKRADDEQKLQAEESRRAIASLPEDQRRALERTLAASAEAQARMNTPEQRALRLQEIRAARAERTTEYEQAVANWRRQYPDDASPAIARRLREFLAVSAEVDFAAALKTTEDGRTRFENPAYEAKSAPWKLCFRAGREATGAARVAVAEWLKELTR